MARVLVIDHHDSYTYSLVHLIAEVDGKLPDVVQHDDVSEVGRWRQGYTHLVLSPGPGTAANPDDFGMGREVIAESPVPVLGVCLGLQGMVYELGGSVEIVAPAHGDVSKVDHCGRGIFSSIPQGFSAVRYHSQAATSTPADLEVTAWCDGLGGRVVMGVRHRKRPLHGVQFHPESLLTEHGNRLVRNFMSLP